MAPPQAMCMVGFRNGRTVRAYLDGMGEVLDRASAVRSAESVGQITAQVFSETLRVAQK